MRNRRCCNRDALEVKVDYVESKLDESLKSLREMIEKSDARLEADRKAAEAKLEADRLAMEKRLANDRMEAYARLKEERERSDVLLAEERRESKATRRSLNAIFVAAITLIITTIGLAFTIINHGLPFLAMQQGGLP